MVQPTRHFGLDARRVRRHSVANSRGLVFFCHGFGLYADKFALLFDQLNALGWDVVTFDALGHGAGCDLELKLEHIDLIAEEAQRVYDRFAAERPILLGVGTFGGFTMRRIIEAAKGSAWVPPAVFYSVEYVRVPGPVLRNVQDDRLLRFLDRFKASYDYRELTSDGADNERFMAEDPRAWWHFSTGLALRMAYETNRFFDLPYSDDSPHAFIIGTADTINYIAPFDRIGSRQPDFRLWKVDGGRLHMHRDRPEVQARFVRALEAALDFVTDQAGPTGTTAATPSADLPAPPEVGGLGTRGQARLLRRLMVDPIGLVESLKRAHGDLFTVRIPFDITPPFTFLTTREGYNTVLSLDPEVGRNGPIIDRVPALARWSPRSDPGPEHLQALLLNGRRFMGSHLRKRPPAELEAAVRSRVRHHIRSWTGTIDLADALVHVIHDTSARLVLGDALFEAMGPSTLAEVRTIVNAVDAKRAASALTPAGRLLPEARATRTLCRRLLALAHSPDADRYPFVQHLRAQSPGLPAEDLSWMLFFALWNATIYMGTYGTWAMLDLLDHPDAMAAVADADAPHRTDRLVGGIIETMRKNPISWQLRALSRPVEVTCDGQRYRVPAGHFLSVYSHGLNRDPEVYPEPLRWRPERYLDGARQPLLFGTGAFACVAQFFVKRVLSTIHAELLDRLDLRLQGPLPPRISRVHLLYPSEPVMVEVRPRT